MLRAMSGRGDEDNLILTANTGWVPAKGPLYMIYVYRYITSSVTLGSETSDLVCTWNFLQPTLHPRWLFFVPPFLGFSSCPPPPP